MPLHWWKGLTRFFSHHCWLLGSILKSNHWVAWPELMFFDSGNKRADRRATPLQRDQARCAEEILIGCREIMMEQSEIWRSDVIPWTVPYCNMFCVEWRVYIHDMLSPCTCCLYIWDTTETLSRDKLGPPQQCAFRIIFYLHRLVRWWEFSTNRVVLPTEWQQPQATSDPYCLYILWVVKGPL